MYTRQLLLKAYNHSPAIQEIIAYDHSGYTEPLLAIADYQPIDSLTTRDNALLPTSLASKVGYTIVGHPRYCLTMSQGNIAFAGY